MVSGAVLRNEVVLTTHSHQKQAERASRIDDLPAIYKEPISFQDQHLLRKPIAELVNDVQSGAVWSVGLLRTYGKVALKAHEKTNCLTEVMLSEAESWAQSKVNLKGPLAGIPVSLKDTVNVRGFDTTVGYSCHVGKPFTKDGTLVRLLKDAGTAPSNFHSTLLPVDV